jgi:hypothetical protein
MMLLLRNSDTHKIGTTNCSSFCNRYIALHPTPAVPLKLARSSNPLQDRNPVHTILSDRRGKRIGVDSTAWRWFGSMTANVEKGCVMRLSHGERAFGLDYQATAGDTLIASCEDDPADTIVPRLLAAGADLLRVHFLEGVSTGRNGWPSQWSLAHHTDLDNHLAVNRAIRLIIIDPASAFAGLAGIDGHKDADLRALLGPLADIAACFGVTILLVAHLGKNETSKAVSRVLGSVGWVNAPRSVMIVAEHEEDGDTRLLLSIKKNLAPHGRGLIYKLVPLSETEQDLALTGCTDLSADDRELLKK